jgi:hypothetical protein
MQLKGHPQHVMPVLQVHLLQQFSLTNGHLYDGWVGVFSGWLCFAQQNTAGASR